MGGVIQSASLPGAFQLDAADIVFTIALAGHLHHLAAIVVALDGIGFGILHNEVFYRERGSGALLFPGGVQSDGTDLKGCILHIPGEQAGGGVVFELHKIGAGSVEGDAHRIYGLAGVAHILVKGKLLPGVGRIVIKLIFDLLEICIYVVGSGTGLVPPEIVVIGSLEAIHPDLDGFGIFSIHIGGLAGIARAAVVHQRGIPFFLDIDEIDTGRADRAGDHGLLVVENAEHPGNAALCHRLIDNIRLLKAGLGTGLLGIFDHHGDGLIFLGGRQAGGEGTGFGRGRGHCAGLQGKRCGRNCRAGGRGCFRRCAAGAEGKDSDPH